jgi:septal ring factor EnvC (AmiA/AmiB activator)
MPRRRPFLLLTLVASTATAGAATGASSPAELRGELQVTGQARDDARAQSQTLRGQIVQLGARLDHLKSIQASGAQGMAAKRAKLGELNARETSLRAQMGDNQAALSGLLGALELFRRDPPPALLVTPGSAKDAVRAAILVRAATPELARRAAAFREQAEELQQIRRSMDTLSEDLFTSESDLAEALAGTEKDLRGKTDLQRQMDADAADADRRAQMLIGQLRAQGAPLSGPIAKPGAPAAAPDVLTPPVQGTLVGRFGQVRGALRSNGLSWRSAPGALVRAPAAGLVEFAGPLRGWGQVVIMDAGGGYRIVVAGLERTTTSAGRAVGPGQVLGAMASQGVSPPQLYLELRKDGSPQDPRRLMRVSPLERAPRQR